MRAAIAIAALLAASRAQASCCVFEDPLLAIGDASGRGGDLTVALEAETLSSRSRMDHGHTIMEERVSQDALRIVVAHSPRERLAIVGAVALVRRAWRVDAGGMRSADAIVASAGDAELAARWAVWRQVAFVPDPDRIAVTRAQALAVSAGTSAPTGENEARRAGVRLPEHAQVGTGAWGPFAGALYRLEREPWGVSGSATIRLRTENRYGYRFGTALLVGADARRDLATRVAAGFGLDVRWAAADRVAGAQQADSGGFLLSAVPALHVGLGRGVQARVRVEVPLFERLRGDQQAGVSLLAGIAWDRP